MMVQNKHIIMVSNSCTQQFQSKIQKQNKVQKQTQPIQNHPNLILDHRVDSFAQIFEEKKNHNKSHKFQFNLNLSITHQKKKKADQKKIM